MAKVPGNDGLDWGLFPSASELPNVSGSSTQNADLVVGARAYVADDGAYVCAVPTVNGATWQTAGTGTDAADIPYTPTTPGDWPNPDPTNVQDALDSLQTQITALPTQTPQLIAGWEATAAVGPVSLDIGGSTNAIVPRAGTATALVVRLSVAPTDDNIQAVLVIESAPVVASLMTFVPAGATEQVVTFSAGYSAADTIAILTEGGAGLTNTPTIYATVEVVPS